MEAQTFIRRRHDELQKQFDRVSDPDGDRVEVLGQLTQMVAAHISTEESFVVPFLKQSGIGGHRLVNRLKSDFRRMGRITLTIERRKGNSPDLPGLVTELEGVYRRHVRRFELYVDPKLNDLVSSVQLDPDQLQAIDEKMESAESTILSHPHAHLISLGPISRFTTRVAALVGRRHGHSPPPGGLWRHRGLTGTVQASLSSRSFIACVASSPSSTAVMAGR
jgi:hypothetical protein